MLHLSRIYLFLPVRAKFVLLVEQRMRKPKEESGQATCSVCPSTKTISAALAQPIRPTGPTSSALPTNVLQQCTRHLRQISRPWFGNKGYGQWPMAMGMDDENPVLRTWLQTRSSRLQDFGSRNSKRNLGKKSADKNLPSFCFGTFFTLVTFSRA